METDSLTLAPLEQALRDEPTSFGFFQAVRLLERMQPARAPVGHFGDPGAEAVRFSANPALAFPPGELHALDFPHDAAPRMSVNFMGLVGPLGVLPYRYSEWIAERARERDHVLAAFLDIFHHRVLSLFYRAWRTHRCTAEPDAADARLAEHLLDLAGVGLESHRSHLPVSGEALRFHAGLLLGQSRSAAALEQLLQAYFGVPAQVEQFVGQWVALSEFDRCALGEEREGATQLGLGAVAGGEVWDPQARVRIRLGPLSRAEYDDFLPAGGAYEALRGLVRFFSHDQFEFELQLVLAPAEIPRLELGAEDAAPPRLGWSTWFQAPAHPHGAEDAVFTLTDERLAA
jgi:type VI secretion system protein ImpH